eukprot:5417256-Pleurochrysis_carterae.AAC.1
MTIEEALVEKLSKCAMRKSVNCTSANSKKAQVIPWYHTQVNQLRNAKLVDRASVQIAQCREIHPSRAALSRLTLTCHNPLSRCIAWRCHSRSQHRLISCLPYLQERRRECSRVGEANLVRWNVHYMSLSCERKPRPLALLEGGARATTGCLARIAFTQRPHRLQCRSRLSSRLGFPSHRVLTFIHTAFK